MAASTRERYKGYWIVTNNLNGFIWIEKDGAAFASCASVEDAKKQIDIVLDGRASQKPFNFDIVTTEGRIPWCRKAESWAEVPPARVDADIANATALLPVFPAEAYPTAYFCDRGANVRPQFFVAVTPDGERFLVDTQGYDYARYVARLPRVE